MRVSEKVWFFTGTSRGFGRSWAIAALERGDNVAATARNTASLDDLAEKYGDALLPIALDVTDREADFAAVRQAHDHFGRLDIVVNNAGYGQFGFVEELSEQDARDQIGGRAAEGGGRRGAAVAGLLRRLAAGDGQGRLREPVTHLGAVAAGRRARAGLTFFVAGGCRYAYRRSDVRGLAPAYGDCTAQ